MRRTSETRTYAAADDAGQPLVIECWVEYEIDDRGQPYVVPCITICTKDGKMLDLSRADEEHWGRWCEQQDTAAGRPQL